MTVHLSPSGVIELQGICPSEDAEALLRYLLARPAAPVDWQACESAHTAVIQVLLLARPTLQGVPTGIALRDWIRPLLLSSKNAEQQ
jgi:hypothetical protein